MTHFGWILCLSFLLDRRMFLQPKVQSDSGKKWRGYTGRSGKTVCGGPAIALPGQSSAGNLFIHQGEWVLIPVVQKTPDAKRLICMPWAINFRSPLTAALFESRLKQEGSFAGWIVGSAGTWVEGESGAHPTAISKPEMWVWTWASIIPVKWPTKWLLQRILWWWWLMGKKRLYSSSLLHSAARSWCFLSFPNGSEVDLQDPALKNFADCDEVFAELCSEMDKAFNGIVRQVTLK